jgi:flagellar motor switch/type III secretory pathway protein FliN
VNESALVPAELEAIQAAIREVSVPLRAQTRPIPLMPVDRVMSTARAELIELASRWAEEAPRALRGQLPGAWQVRVTDIELVESGAGAQGRGEWLVAGHTGGAAAFLLSIHGALIEAVAARRCGDGRGRGDNRRPPSPAALQLFEATGWAVMESWMAVWKSPVRKELHPTRAAAAIEQVVSRPELLRISLSWSGSVQGKCQVYVAPSALVPPGDELVPGGSRAVLDRLADVSVELCVELGTLRLGLDQVRHLQPGACFALQTFIDSRVPVYVGGVLKAWGTPVIHRGVLAVAIEEVVGARAEDDAADDDDDAAEDADAMEGAGA